MAGVKVEGEERENRGGKDRGSEGRELLEKEVGD